MFYFLLTILDIYVLLIGINYSLKHEQLIALMDGHEDIVSLKEVNTTRIIVWTSWCCFLFVTLIITYSLFNI